MNCGYRIDNHGTGWVYVIFADKPANIIRTQPVGTCIEIANRLRSHGFDALVFPDTIPDYVPLREEAII